MAATRYGGEKTDGEIGEAEGLEHLRHPEADAVKPDHQAKIDQAELDHARIGKRLADSRIAVGARLLRLGGETLIERITLFSREPFGVLGPVGEELEGEDPEQYRGDALDDEEPAPAVDTQKAMQAEQSAGEWTAEHRCDGNRRHEQRHDAGALCL